ncbi:hypothetical protein BRD05_05265 [Halobacteriales archaeon QS_9_70_65]|nr:MAG: hypothetical protein BRD05_05265 [Halobacteriales archaeon QS_9_70_65]
MSPSERAGERGPDRPRRRRERARPLDTDVPIRRTSSPDSARRRAPSSRPARSATAAPTPTSPATSPAAPSEG